MNKYEQIEEDVRAVLKAIEQSKYMDETKEVIISDEAVQEYIIKSINNELISYRNDNGKYEYTPITIRTLESRYAPEVSNTKDIEQCLFVGERKIMGRDYVNVILNGQFMSVPKASVVNEDSNDV